MNITYIANARIPTDKAHGLQIAKMCEAFAQVGHQVTLIVPKRYNKIKKDIFSYYKVEKIFKVKRIFCFDAKLFHLISGKLIYFPRTVAFAKLLFLSPSVHQAEIIYTRDFFSTFWLSFIKKNIYYEMHDYIRSKRFLYKIYFKNLKGIVTTNQWKREKLIKDFKVDPKKVIALPNAVSLEEFSKLPNQNQIKEKYKIPKDKIVFSYIGKFKTLEMEKGLNLILDAFKDALKENENIYLVIAGGGEREIDIYQKKIEELKLKNNVKLLPHVAYNQVKEYFALPDVFLLTYPKNDHYNFYMCPIKLMEYVASAKPVITSDLNSVRELFTDDEVSYFEPGNASQLKNKIIELADSSKIRKSLSEKSFSKIKNKDWQARATQIIQFIKSQINTNDTTNTNRPQI